jgi:hypothetical protein
VYIFSSLHTSGEQLANLSGIAAILRSGPVRSGLLLTAAAGGPATSGDST